MTESFPPGRAEPKPQKDVLTMRIEGLSRSEALGLIIKIVSKKVKPPPNIVSIIEDVIDVNERALSKLPLGKMNPMQSVSYKKFNSLLLTLTQEDRHIVSLLIKRAALIDLFQSYERDSR